MTTGPRARTGQEQEWVDVLSKHRQTEPGCLQSEPGTQLPGNEKDRRVTGPLLLGT